MKKHPLAGYVNDLATRMGLGSWVVTISTGVTDEEDAYAETTIWRERFQGDIILNEKWTPASRSELREIVVHELLHLHFADLDHALQSTSPLLGLMAFTPISDRYRTDREKTVRCNHSP
jgi:hypothetical protein